MGKSVLMRLSRSLRSSQETARWTRSRLLADEMNYYRARTNAVLRAVQLDKVELENGSEAMRKVVCHPGGVSAAILTDKNEILFGRQIRYPYAQTVLECPAGKIEPGEDPLEAMKRRQKEETGTTSSRCLDLGKLYPTPGYCDEILHLYACRIDSYGEKHLDEFLEVEKIPLAQAVEMAEKNEIFDAKTQVLILRAVRLVERGEL